MESLRRYITLGSADSGKGSTDGYVLYTRSVVSLSDVLQTIESVEQEVERLLDEDSLATEVKYGMLQPLGRIH
jgi:sulfate adenylyltransferase subunit 1 (EFTu-like GTPase family)